MHMKQMNGDFTEVTIEKANQQKAIIEKADAFLIRAEAQLEQLKQREQEYIKALADDGVDAENLEEELERMESEAIRLYKAIEASIPYNLLEKFGVI